MLPGGAGKMGLGGMAILLVLSLVFGQDFLSQAGGGPGVVDGGEVAAPVTDPREEPMVQFVSFVLDDAQATWAKILPQYREAKLVLFRDAANTACGYGQAATGPFYCPGDEKVYIDLGFYQELKDKFGAPGDFAQAYVLAHEIGHHVQTLLGTNDQVGQLQRSRPGQANQLSVRMELQADCYAGVWAHSTSQRNLLESGDVQEGMAAAASVGDDRIQRMGGGAVNPDGFTHGSSAQRMEWFKRGLDTGRPESCDTFATR
jgi:predicted metalloprotease